MGIFSGVVRLGNVWEGVDLWGKVLYEQFLGSSRSGGFRLGAVWTVSERFSKVLYGHILLEGRGSVRLCQVRSGAVGTGSAGCGALGAILWQ